MFRRSIPLTLCAVALIAAGCEHASAPQEPRSQTLQTSGSFGRRVIPGSYVVILKPSTSDAATVGKALATQYGGTVQFVYRKAVRGVSMTISDVAAARMRFDARVLRIDQDVEVLAKPTEGKSVGKKGQNVSYGVTRVGGPRDGTGRRVWIVDSGIDLDNADLSVDRTRSISFVPKTTSADDDNGHGTHVAGIIAAKNNTTGTVGVAANATVIAVKVLDKKGFGQASWIVAGVEHVLANAAAGDVVNLSLGGGFLPALDDAVLRLAEAGVKVVVAAGNDGADCSFSSPARVNHANVYTVSASDDTDRFWSSSNYGFGIIDYAAPGVDILSLKKGGGVKSMSGTSMAAPHVAGLILAGSLRSDGRIVIGDIDGQPDPIAVY